VCRFLEALIVVASAPFCTAAAGRTSFWARLRSLAAMLFRSAGSFCRRRRRRRPPTAWRCKEPQACSDRLLGFDIGIGGQVGHQHGAGLRDQAGASSGVGGAKVHQVGLAVGSCGCDGPGPGEPGHGRPYWLQITDGRIEVFARHCAGCSSRGCRRSKRLRVRLAQQGPWPVANQADSGGASMR